MTSEQTNQKRGVGLAKNYPKTTSNSLRSLFFDGSKRASLLLLFCLVTPWLFPRLFLCRSLINSKGAKLEGMCGRQGMHSDDRCSVLSWAVMTTVKNRTWK